MVLSESSIAPGTDLDPAVLAFIKCHVTSSLKWEAMRVLGAQEGAWVSAQDVARATHRGQAEVEVAVGQLVREGVIEQAATPPLRYRVPLNEPTSVVLQRLIAGATHSLELRSIIAAHLGALRLPTAALRAS
jgi:hypothetical protein